MTSIPFVTLDDPHYGEAMVVAPLVRRVVAQNPSKFTYLGTGTYVIGEDAPGAPVAVIDPGPRLDGHQEALIRALDGHPVLAILVTHCHSDHSPLSEWLREFTGAPTVAFGPHPAPTDDELDEGSDADEIDAADAAAAPAAATDPVGAADAAPGDTGMPRIEESTDYAFTPDVRVVDGDVAVSGPGWTLRAVFTPGHTSNHTCFALDEHRALFTGDHVMGWSTTVIAPPDGDMRSYFDSLRRVQGRADRTLWPTHGAPVTDPAPYLAAFLEHRLEREENVLAAVRSGRRTTKQIVSLLYADVRVELHEPARRSVLSHLVKLVDDGLVAVDGGGRPRLRSLYAPA